MILCNYFDSTKINFNFVSVERFVKYVAFWEIGIYQVLEGLGCSRCDIFTLRWVKP